MTMLVFFLLLALLSHAKSQCMTSTECGCSSISGISCCLMVQENGAAITEVGVNDIDFTDVPNPQYSLTNTFNGAFSIDETGVISTQRTLDRELEGNKFSMFIDNGYCFILGISVTENLALESGVLVKVVDVNDNPPTFQESSYVIDVPETTTSQPTYECTQEVRNLLMAVDTDEGDNALVRYTVENTNFMITDPSVPCVTNVPSFILDRDEPPTNYSFTLVATNLPPSNFSSRTTVTYVLQDRNDNPPVFENATYTLSIREDVQPMSEIFQFRARDLDLGSNGEDSLTYSIRNGEGIFGMNMTSGFLMLIGEVDAEDAVNSYTLEVVVRDGGSLTGTANVVVSITDVNEPANIVVTNDINEISENDDMERIAFIRVEDGDVQSNNNSLEVVGGEEVFIAKFSPLVSSRFVRVYILQQVQNVDFEQNRTIQILLRSTEMGDPPITQYYRYNLTVLDVNDNHPNLIRTEFSLVEERSDQLIADLSQYVSDFDSGANGMIGEYRLVSVRNSTNDLTSAFEGTLDSNTGELRTGNVRIDREALGNSLDYMVDITDMGVPPLTQRVNFTVMILDVNDNSPDFQMPSYTFFLEENLPRDTPIGTVVQATDNDYLDNGIIFYSIEGDPQFSINLRTGQIASENRFDRETRESYQIIVTAQDGGDPPRTAQNAANVTIRITDVNDENPLFLERHPSFKIDTSLRPGSEIGRVMAMDEDLSPFNETIYKLESNSSFSIQESSGVITLESPLTSMEMFQLNVSAFNPGREAYKDTITVVISVTEAPTLQIPLIAGVAGGASVLVIMIVVVFVIIMCLCCRNRRYSQYNMKEISNNLNNVQQPRSIRKLPFSGINQQSRSRVTFNDSVDVIDTDNTVRKESVAKFDNFPKGRHQYSNEEEEGASHNHGSPKDLPTVDELEMSPGHMMNGNIPPSHHIHAYEQGPHSPIVHVMNGRTREEVDYSQNTSTYMDDEESMFSDDASIVVTALSRYPDLDARYRTLPSHSHLDLHHHLPPISHGQPTSSSLAQLQAHNQKQLAEAKRQQQYEASLHNTTSEHEHSLTVTPHDHLQHASISTQSTCSPPSPRDHAHSHIATSASSSSNHIHSGGRNYPHPLIMPSAFPPRDTTDIHRFPIGSYADYGEASTYASADLDEALGFNLETEPGIISLTTTDYEDTEL